VHIYRYRELSNWEGEGCIHVSKVNWLNSIVICWVNNGHIQNAFGTGIHIVIITILYEFDRLNLISEVLKTYKNLMNEAFFIKCVYKN